MENMLNEECGKILSCNLEQVIKQVVIISGLMSPFFSNSPGMSKSAHMLLWALYNYLMCMHE